MLKTKNIKQMTKSIIPCHNLTPNPQFVFVYPIYVHRLKKNAIVCEQFQH